MLPTITGEANIIMLKEYDKALQDFHTAIQINPQYAAAYSNICNVYFS